MADKVAGHFVPAVLVARDYVRRLGARWTGTALGPCFRQRHRCPNHRLPLRARVWPRRCPSWSASGAGRNAGILIKDAQAMEMMEKVARWWWTRPARSPKGDRGCPRVVPAPGIEPNELLRLARRLEKEANTHRDRDRAGRPERGSAAPVKHFESISGGGVSGRVDGREILIGKPKLVQSESVLGKNWKKRERFADGERRCVRRDRWQAAGLSPLRIDEISPHLKPSPRSGRRASRS